MRVGPQVDDLAHLRDGEASRATRRGRARTARPRTRRPRARWSCRPLPRRRSRPGAPGASAGQRLGNQRTSYGSGASRPPTQNGQPLVGQVRPRLAVPDDVHPLAGERVEAQLAGRARASRNQARRRTAGMTSAAKRSRPSRSNGARDREDHVRRAGVDVRADLVDHLLHAAREHARLHRVRHRAELAPQLLVGERHARR